MTGAHDVGGASGFGAVDPRDDERGFHHEWEARVFAINSTLLKLGLYTLDEFRYAIERMDPQRYRKAWYYERWLHAIETLLEGDAAPPPTAHADAHAGDHERSSANSRRVKALILRLEQRGITTEARLDALVEDFLAHARPENGYRVVARAWTDPAYKARLLADANAAVEEIGVDLSHWSPVKLRVVENTPGQHNLIVCTLCSCYPIALLGPSPAWYKSEAYRARAVREPRAVLADFGVRLADGVPIAVWDSTAEARYMVLPQRPAGTESLDEGALARLVTRNGLIGTALV